MGTTDANSQPPRIDDPQAFHEAAAEAALERALMVPERGQPRGATEVQMAVGEAIVHGLLAVAAAVERTGGPR